MFNRKEFNEKIQNEYKEFKTKILGLSKEEIYERSLEIVFKTNAGEFLQNDLLTSDEFVKIINKIDGLILDYLFGFYIDLHLDHAYDQIDEVFEEFAIYYDENLKVIE